MERLELLVKKFETLPIKDFIKEVIADNKELIEDKNAEQMFRGELPDGSQITPPYKDITVAIKSLKGQPTDRVTLKDSGDFYKGITLNLESDSFTLDNTDEKTEGLIVKYGDPLGLSEQSREEIKEEVFKPFLLEKFKTYLEV